MADTQTITYAFVGNASGLVGAAGAATNALGAVEGAAGKTLGALGSIVAGAAKATAALAAIGAGAAVALGGNAIKVAADFEQQISAIAAVSSKTEVEVVGGMKAISAAALELGKSTSFSASEAAAGMEEMVKAGVSLKDVMGGGAKAVLDLAAAGALEVAEAATVASNAMNSFALAGSDLPHIADQLANAANASATDVHQLGFALAAVGAVAHTVGFSFDDTTTAIALFAQNGLKGSDAGTSLKTMLLNLSPSTKPAIAAMRELGLITEDGSNQFFDAQGNVKSMAEVAGILQHATANLTKEQKLNALQTIFGTDAIRAAAIMAEHGAEGFNAMAQAEKDVGGAGAVARERLNNLKGAMEALGGSWEVVRIKIGTPFLPVLTKAVQGLTEALNDAEPTISAFADRAAAGLEKILARVTATAPRLVALGSGLLAFGQQGLALARTVLPALTQQITAFAESFNLGGIGTGASSLAGGLIGAFREIEPVLMSVGRAIVGNITDTLTFLTTRVLPPVVFAVQQIGTVLERTLLPAAAATGAVLRGILGDTLDWLARTVLPPLLSIIEQTANFWTQVILPTLPAVAAALRTTLGETVQWLSTDVWPKLRDALTVVWTFISGTIAPGLPVLARVLRDLLGGAIQWLATTGWPALVKGAQAAWSFLQDKVIPVIRDTYDWLRVKLPEAINTAVSTFETIKGKVGPIVQAALNGDILAAIRNLGSAFGEFAALATGWLGAQVAAIDWATVWAKAIDVATALGTYVFGLAVDFATWLGEQVAAIPWSSVWQRTVDAAGALLTYLLAQAINFATWLGQEVAKIPWAVVWTSITQAAETLATYLQGLAVDFATWLGEQVAAIPWPQVWASVTGIAEAAQAEFTTQMARVDWYAIFDTAHRAETDILRWLTDVIRRITWEDVGREFGTQLASMFQGKVDWNAIGMVLAEQLGLMFGVAVASGEAWVAFNKGFVEGIVKQFTGMDPAEAARALGTWLGTVIRTAWDDAMRSFTPSRPSWLPPSVPWPFGPQPGAGQQFPVAPGAPGATAAPGGGTPVTNTSTQAQRIARAKQLAIERGLDPDLFAAQLMQESSFDVNAFAENNAGGARGIGQFIPSTGTTYANRLGVTYEQMVADAELSMQAASMYMQDLTQQFGSQERALSAYFAGPGGGVRPDYVNAVRGRLPQVADVPASQGAAPGGNMVTYQDQWGNQYTVTQDQFNARPGGNADVTVIAGQVGQATKVSAPTGINMASFAVGNQFEMGLPLDQAMAACGPAAAMLFLQATGRTPNTQEVMRIASLNGWTAGGGMTSGPAGVQRTLSGLGIDYATLPATAGAAAQSAAAGNLTAISTGGGNVPVSAGHYFVAQGFNPETGEFDLGETGGGPGGALKGGSRFMTAAQIEALAGPINGVIQLVGQAGQAFETMSQKVDMTTQAASNMTPALSAIGASIDPVVAGFTEGTVSATGMTDAIIASAAQQGVGIATSEQYAAGLITQDQAMQGVLAGFAATTPAAAELLTQLQAGTITTDQAAVAFAGLATTTATSTGAIVTAAQTMQPAVQASFDLMAEGSTVATTTLGTNVLTSITDTAGNMTSTWAAAGGAIITQTATMANGVTISTADMGTTVASTFDEMSGTTQTTVTDQAGNILTTVTDMAGDVVSQTATMASDAIAEAQRMQADTTSAAESMGSDVTSTISEMVSDASTEFQKIEEPAQSATQIMEDLGQVEIDAPDVGDIVSAMRKVERAAEAAKDALDDVGKGGSKHASEFAKRAGGGPVSGLTPYMVGETGPELFIPGSDGQIVSNSDLRNGQSGGGRTDTIRFMIASPDGRTLEEWYVMGKDLATRRGRT